MMVVVTFVVFACGARKESAGLDVCSRLAIGRHNSAPRTSWWGVVVSLGHKALTA
jgi:hypothetical protein